MSGASDRKSAVRLERVDSTTVANPLLWEKGIKVMLGVPLVSADSVVGVLHVGRLRSEVGGTAGAGRLDDRSQSSPVGEGHQGHVGRTPCKRRQRCGCFACRAPQIGSRRYGWSGSTRRP